MKIDLDKDPLESFAAKTLTKFVRMWIIYMVAILVASLALFAVFVAFAYHLLSLL